MEGCGFNSNKGFAHGSSIRTSSQVSVVAPGEGDKWGVRGAVPPQGTGSAQASLGVYVQISANSAGHPTLRVAHNLEEYTHFASVAGRLDRLKFEREGAVWKRLRDVRKRLRVIDARLEREHDKSERARLLDERARLVRESLKLLELVQKREVLYGGRFYVSVPSRFLSFVHQLGYAPSAVDAQFWVSSSVVDVRFVDDSRATLKFSFIDHMHTGKLHPAKALSKGATAARRVFSDVFALAYVWEGSMLSAHKKRNSVYFTTVNELPARFFVLTVPSSLSLRMYELYRSGDEKVFANFRSAVSKTIRDFLIERARREGISLKKEDAQVGFVVNIHLTGDDDPFRPHVHAHVFVLLVVFDKKSNRVYRLRPLFDKDDIALLRSIWQKEILKRFDVPVEDAEKVWDVHVGDEYFNVADVRSAPQLLFSLRYNSRKFSIDYARYLESHSAPDSFDEEFVRLMLDYENRTYRYGFLVNVERVLRVFAVERVRRELERVHERISLVESDLLSAGASEREYLLRELDELCAEEKRLLRALQSESEALAYVRSVVEERLSQLLSREALLEARLRAFLESVSFKDILSLRVHVYRRNEPLSSFLARKRSLLLVADSVKSFYLAFYFDPFWEGPPPPP